MEALKGASMMEIPSMTEEVDMSNEVTNHLAPGDRVSVWFRGRKLTGVVLAVTGEVDRALVQIESADGAVRTFQAQHVRRVRI